VDAKSRREDGPPAREKELDVMCGSAGERSGPLRAMRRWEGLSMVGVGGGWSGMEWDV
jgi:hypothetical protein